MEYNLKMDIKLMERMRKWLDLSDLQYEILVSIYNLQKRREKTNPSSIEKEYKKRIHADLKQPSMFVSLRELAKKKVIIKGVHSNYYVNPDGIKKKLSKKNTDLKAELKEFDKSSKNVDTLLENISSSIEPNITHMKINDLVNLQTEHLKESKNHIGVTNTCMLAWTKNITNAYAKIVPSITDFVETQKNKVLVERDMNHNFITKLDPLPIFGILTRMYGRKKAAAEIVHFLDNVESILETHKNVQLHNIEFLGMPFFIPYQDKPKEAFLVIRDSLGIYMAGIHIFAPDIAEELRKDFLNLHKTGINLRTKKGADLIRLMKASYMKSMQD